MPLDVAVAVILHEGRILICRRLADKPLGGLWEFPGGKCEVGEPPRACVRREVREELAIDVEPFEALDTIDHAYPERRVRLHAFLCRWAGGPIRPLAVAEFRWIAPPDLPHYPFPPANAPLLHEIQTRLHAPRTP